MPCWIWRGWLVSWNRSFFRERVLVKSFERPWFFDIMFPMAEKLLAAFILSNFSTFLFSPVTNEDLSSFCFDVLRGKWGVDRTAAGGELLVW